MADIPISIICSSIRPKRWIKIYSDFIQSNDLNFEIIFIGPRKVSSSLPKKIKFIKSNLPPAHCYEFAARRAGGEYLMPISDDILFKENVLDKLYSDYASRISNKYVVVSPIFTNYFKEDMINHMRLVRKHPKSPIVPICGLYNKEKWHELGGIDRRFTTVWWDIDLALRFYEAGGAPFLAHNCPLALAPIPGKLSNTKTAGKQRKLLLKFWTETVKKDGVKVCNIRDKRKVPVESIVF